MFKRVVAFLKKKCKCNQQVNDYFLTNWKKTFFPVSNVVLLWFMSLQE